MNNKELVKRWKEHQQAHPFGLLTPIPTDADVTQEINAKLGKIAQYVDPELSEDAQLRLYEVLKMLPGFQPQGKQGQKDQSQAIWQAVKRKRYRMALVIEYMNNHKKVSQSKAAELVGFHGPQISKWRKEQPEQWERLLTDAKHRQIILASGERQLTAEEEAAAAQWADDHPARPKEDI